ncbi:hypothetical protein CsSME_00051823 [Camellia sinensis var. sinensis]
MLFTFVNTIIFHLIEMTLRAYGCHGCSLVFSNCAFLGCQTTPAYFLAVELLSTRQYKCWFLVFQEENLYAYFLYHFMALDKTEWCKMEFMDLIRSVANGCFLFF